MKKWISMEKTKPELGKLNIFRLPKQHKTLIGFLSESNGGQIRLYESSNERKSYQEKFISHWMPLPDPPKGEIKEEEDV